MAGRAELPRSARRAQLATLRCAARRQPAQGSRAVSACEPYLNRPSVPSLSTPTHIAPGLLEVRSRRWQRLNLSCKDQRTKASATELPAALPGVPLHPSELPHSQAGQTRQSCASRAGAVRTGRHCLAVPSPAASARHAPPPPAVGPQQACPTPGCPRCGARAEPAGGVGTGT